MLLIDCIFIVLAPAAVVLPLFGGYEGFLNFSFIIFAFALLHSLMRLAFRVNISWLWMVGAVVTYGIIGSSVAISWLSSVFAALTQISLPIMIVIEGLLTVLCIQGIGQYLMFHISHFPRSSSAVKTAVLAVTLLSFLSIVAFSLPVFVDSETSATRAAAYASVLTLLILLTIANILNENAIISDAALLGAYLLLNFYLIQSATGVVIADETSSNWWQWWNGTTLKTWFQPAVAVGDWLSALRALISLSSLLVVMYRLAVFTLSYILIQSLRGNDPFSTPSDSEEASLIRCKHE
jgi:hypothetical protein